MTNDQRRFKRTARTITRELEAALAGIATGYSKRDVAKAARRLARDSVRSEATVKLGPGGDFVRGYTLRT